MRNVRSFLAIIALLLLVARHPGRDVHASATPDHSSLVQLPEQPDPAGGAQPQHATLATIWPPAVTRWEPTITTLAPAYGLDPDFVAAVIAAESDGETDAISREGAVGLMGVMPSRPGLEWRPSTEELTNPVVNLHWGISILAEIVRQSGGDLFAALAAYSGGWDQVNSQVPREYAANVLHDYGRAVAARSGVDPAIATRWTIAITIARGYIPADSLLVLGSNPLSGLHTYGEHVVYQATDKNGRAYYVRGYAVPLALVVPLDDAYGLDNASDRLEPALMRYLGHDDTKLPNSNPRVLLACLPSLSRLRGRASTRWFAPSACPSWHR